MTFPLRTLRQWIMDKLDIVEEKDGNSISTRDQNGTTQTIDLSQDSEYIEKQGKGESFLPMKAIWFLYKTYIEEGTSYRVYFSNCRQNGIPSIVFADVEEIRSYLNGSKSTLAGLVKEETIPIQQPQSTTSTLPTATTTTDTANTTSVSLSHEAPQIQEKPIFERVTPSPEAISSGPVIKYETLRTLNSVLCCAHDFSRMTSINDSLKHIDNRPKNINSGVDDDSSFIHSTAGIHPKPSNSARQNSIILVPRTTTSTINNSNIQKFLVDNVWTPPEVVESKKIMILHRSDLTQRTMRFDVICDEKELKPEDWDRVVCIFLSGYKWQIRTYNPNDPRKLFSKVLGIYVGPSQTVPNDINSWKIQKYVISPDPRYRYRDPEIAMQIWQEIEKSETALRKERDEE